MVSAEPHIYITVPSVRIWAKNHRLAVAALAFIAVVAVLAVVACLLS
ncbi:hypothetical protein VST63_25865 [Mycolicibacterium sp. 050232]|nr:hypothetical protein [Mycolicibacterium sp. 050232]MED5815800.1 hypothetical protein [Mycolicibacterium sp. 050232]